MPGRVLAEVRLTRRATAVAFVFALPARIGWRRGDVDVTERFELVDFQMYGGSIDRRLPYLGGVTEQQRTQHAESAPFELVREGQVWNRLEFLRPFGWFDAVAEKGIGRRRRWLRQYPRRHRQEQQHKEKKVDFPAHVGLLLASKPRKIAKQKGYTQEEMLLSRAIALSRQKYRAGRIAQHILGGATEYHFDNAAVTIRTDK